MLLTKCFLKLKTETKTLSKLRQQNKTIIIKPPLGVLDNFLYFFFLNLKSIFLYILNTNQFLLPPLFRSPPLSHLTAAPYTLFHLHSERGRPSMDLRKAWHIKMRRDQAPPLTLSQDHVIQQGEQVIKSQLRTREGSFYHS